MTWGITSATTLPKGARPAGTALTPQLSSPAIMCIGDSWTYGYSYAPAFRKMLHDRLTTAGLSPTWIGPVNNGTAPANNHHGVSGTTVVDHDTGGSADSVSIIGAGHTYRPDVMIVFLGINDANDATLTTNFSANYQSLMNNLHAAEPDARFVCVSKIPACGTPTRRGRINTINGVLPSALTSLDSAGLRVARAPCRVNDFYADFPDDFLHPTERGYIKLCDAIFPALMNACGYSAVW